MRLHLAIVGAAAVAVPTTDDYTVPADLAHYCNYEGTRAPPKLPKLEGTVLQAHVFARHGARSFSQDLPAEQACWHGQEFAWECSAEDYPIEHSPVDSQAAFRRNYMRGRNQYKGTCAVGQLVKAGFDQHRHNGQALAERYVSSLLPAELEKAQDQIFLRCDDSPRVVESAQMLFSAMYPKGADGAEVVMEWNIEDMKYDEINPMNTCAAEFKKAAEKVKQSAEYQADYEKYVTSVQRRLNPFWVVQDQDLGIVGDCFWSSICTNLPTQQHTIPTAFIENDWKLAYDMRKGFDFFWSGWFGDKYPETQRLGVGPFLRDLLTNIENDDVKFFLTGGHDTGPLAPLLAALGLYEKMDYPWPQFASMALLEVYEVDDAPGQRYIRLIFEGKELHLDFCGDGRCALERFVKHVQTKVPSQEECANLEPRPSENTVTI